MILSFCHEEVIQHLFFTIVLCDIYGPFSSCTYVWSWRLVKWSGKTIKITSTTWGSSGMLVYQGCARMILFFRRKRILSIAGYLCNFSQAPFVSYPSTAGVLGYGCNGIATIGAGGEGYHYPGILAAIYYYDWMSLEHAQNTFKLNLCVYHLGRGCEVVSRPCINSMYWS